MSKFYERRAELEPYTTARSDDVRNEFDAVQSAFELLAEPRKDGVIGYLTPFTIVDPVENNHPATHAQVTAEHSKNSEQDARLNNTENLIAGMGPMDARFTTLRYMADDAQETIVLPAQFQSLAYVHKNGGRLHHTVGFTYDVDTKTITFTDPLALNDEVLVDVGIVPDAVLADLIFIQDDIKDRQSDVTVRQAAVADMKDSVTTMAHEVESDRSTVDDYRHQALESRQLAESSEGAAKVSEDNAKASELRSEEVEASVRISEDNAKASELRSEEVEANVKISEDNAKASEEASKESEESARASVDLIAGSPPVAVATNMIRTQTLIAKLHSMA